MYLKKTTCPVYACKLAIDKIVIATLFMKLAYTGQVPFYRAPKEHGRVYLVGLFDQFVIFPKSAMCPKQTKKFVIQF